MSKKQYLMKIIENFEQNAAGIPSDLQNKLDQIKRQLAAISEDDFELGANGAVTTPAQDQPIHSNHPVDLLREAYSEMEKIAYTGDLNEELHSTILQMRGYLGIADRMWP